MKRNFKFVGAMIVMALGLTFFGCDEGDWTDEATDEESSEYADYDEEADSEGDDEDAEFDESSVDATLTSRCGFEFAAPEGSIDENPDRKIRRSVTPIGQTVETKLDGTPLPENFYLYRETWSDAGRRAYDQICAGLTAREPVIVMNVGIKTENISGIYYSVLYDHPELFWVSTNMSFSYNQSGVVTQITPQYYEYDPESMKSEVANSVDQALADMWSLPNDIDKVKYAHDYLVNHITYTKNDLDQNAYSGFAWGQTVCAGYSRCFQYMMHKMGIRCAMVVGFATENHAWNIVELNGEFYAMDITWDDPDNGTYQYNYFNITDGELSKNHTRGHEGMMISTYLPVANGTYFSYRNYYGGNAVGTDFGAIHGDMPAQVADNGGVADDTGDGDYDDYDDTYTYSDYDDETSGWWNLLDPNWTMDDWAFDDEGGYWYIWDEDTDSTYVYYENEDEYAVYDSNSEIWYWLDASTGEWVAEDEY
ncbi:MAG: hypothetical protein K6G75_05910 [Lachnospiraceae bacterium]|nr:hypothetical protein [Lachnospiraceae bacterium]